MHFLGGFVWVFSAHWVGLVGLSWCGRGFSAVPPGVPSALGLGRCSALGRGRVSAKLLLLKERARGGWV